MVRRHVGTHLCTTAFASSDRIFGLHHRPHDHELGEMAGDMSDIQVCRQVFDREMPSPTRRIMAPAQNEVKADFHCFDIPGSLFMHLDAIAQALQGKLSRNLQRAQSSSYRQSFVPLARSSSQAGGQNKVENLREVEPCHHHPPKAYNRAAGPLPFYPGGSYLK